MTQKTLIYHDPPSVTPESLRVDDVSVVLSGRQILDQVSFLLANSAFILAP